MRFRPAFAVDATGKVVNVGSTGYGSLISHETVHCICQCHVLRVYEIENRFQIIYRRHWSASICSRFDGARDNSPESVLDYSS